eukprot:273653-Amphidinium_carterae.2
MQCGFNSIRFNRFLNMSLLLVPSESMQVDTLRHALLLSALAARHRYTCNTFNFKQKLHKTTKFT